MSIVAYYASLSPTDFETAVNCLEKLASGDVSQFPQAQFIDVDRAWDPIAWLVSECKRSEQAHNTRVMQHMMEKRKPKGLLDRARGLLSKGGPDKELVAAAQALVKIEPDISLIGIEGRGLSKEGRIDFGMGPACVFSPVEVAEISNALGSITEDQVRKRADFEEMDRNGVFPDQWVEDGQNTLNEYILPHFRRLQEFYAVAAKRDQMVIMWYT